MVWGWVVVGEQHTWHVLSTGPHSDSSACATMLVGLAMAGESMSLHDVILAHHLEEVCSAHPTSGGPYFWAAMLSDPKNAPLASWITGWFNLLGQVAVTTGIRCASL